MNIKVKHYGYAVEMNEDGEFVCPHYNVKIEDNSFDYAGTHCNYGIGGTLTLHNAVCQDCGGDISDGFDWDGFYQNKAEAGLDL